MNYHFDNISKQSIIDSIIPLAQRLKKAKLKINLPRGLVTHTDGDRVGISTNAAYCNLPITNLSEKELMIVLRYLENMDKCREIVIKNTRYGELFDLRRKKWEKTPCNKDEVKKKIKEYLSRKKNIATLDLRKEGPTSIKRAGKYLKDKLYDIRVKYSKNADGCYDYNENRFIIVIDKYDESEFAMSLVYLITDLVMKFKTPCYVLTLKEFTHKTCQKNSRILYL